MEWYKLAYGALSFIISMIGTSYICNKKYHYIIWDSYVTRPLILVGFFIFWPVLIVGYYLQFLYFIWKS